MKKTIFVVILFLSAWLVLFPSSTLASQSVCQASSMATAKDCFNKLNNGSVNAVEVTTPIACSGENACAFSLNNINRPVLIYGTPNTNAGFTITDSNNYSILTVNNSSQVTISNLILNDTSGIHCEFWYGYFNPCYAPPMVFSGGANNVIDGITIENSRYQALEISEGNNLTIKNSKFLNNSWFGIAIDNVENNHVNPPVALHIENNLFQDNSTSAIGGPLSGTADNPSTIKNNVFINNHRQAIFAVCGPNNLSPCGGGQLFIDWYTQNLVIANNTIKDGSLDVSTAGIELTAYLSDLTIENNDIHHNTGAGIILNGGIAPPPCTTTCNIDINILNNMVYGNAANLVGTTGTNTSGNCETAGCNPNAGVIPTPTPTQPSCSLRSQGDADCDGKVDMIDYYYLVQALNGGKTPPSVNLDFNGDGEIGLSDRAIIVKTLHPG